MMILSFFSVSRVESSSGSVESGTAGERPLVSGLRRVRHELLLALGVLLLMVGCDPSVQPFAPSDRYHYSVFGVLNPVEDTQWVRVEPISVPSHDGAPRTLDATVTLEHVESGQTWVLRDSVMEVVSGEPQHNFWTTAPIAAGSTYRLAVQNGEGDTTRATTTTPNAPPTTRVRDSLQLPCIPSLPRANRFNVRVLDTENLAALQVRYYQTFQKSVYYTFDWYDETTKNGERYEATIDYLDDLRTANPQRGKPCTADSAFVIAAAGGPDWPAWGEYSGASLTELTRPDSFSNVQGGHGTFLGVYSDTTKVEVRQR
jgi:hypothetical protein